MVMDPLRMVDLKGQYLRIKKEVDDAVLEVLNSTAFINGPAVQEFSRELEHYLDINHVIPCANGTDALQLAMMALNLKPADEVITADFTFIATVETIALLGLKPVLIDVEPGDFNMDPGLIEKAITKRTKAIIPVHLYGQCARMEDILNIARKHNLFVIEDAAQATGSDYIFQDGRRQKSGTLGDIGCTSFFPSKNLGAYGDGGALFTDNDSLAGHIRSIANHGMRRQYYHDDIGVNSRLDSVQAAVLKIKLSHLDTFNSLRQEAASKYDAAFSNMERLIVPERVPWSTHIFHQYTLKTKGINRHVLLEELKAKSIPAAIYYPVPLHRQEAFRYLKCKDEQFPVTEQLSKTVFSLPMHTELSDEQIDHITGTVIEIVKNL